MVFSLISYVFSFFQVDEPVFYGAIIYFVLIVLLKRTIPRYHRKGIKYFKNKKYDLAIKEFKKSYAFFKTFNWIDKYRIIVLLSSSRISYSEMALINMAYCYSQIGEGNKSKELYENVLQEFPNSEIALSALKIYESAKKIN
ncbi:tetratricopeptide repeat protein [Oceanirhabdus sp. W0125-5]|uniref:tetratricopeptide repeat protein n=1 Tax=Oceanirhabdus sp. W0125-5 TaxID=2999116 RepID=UPI0022F33CF7|nr:hypothetical protein [Oceanirhabdus sp. W0125-5]WBW98153.1 hypothetical protein OW730_05140 [Oceanirhabdus sp. W0125-5]